jgi:hypothetical protein
MNLVEKIKAKAKSDIRRIRRANAWYYAAAVIQRRLPSMR